jgi:predicted phosphoribosyltransferase
LFLDRSDAGARLAERLGAYRGPDTLVLGIPRGGVPVAAAVARALGAELDVVVARKLAAPISEELAIGAITADGGRFLNQEMVRSLDVDEKYIERVTQAQKSEAARREIRFRGDAAAPRIAGRTVVLVDDGLATGATMIAAARSVRAKKPSKLIVAVPVGSREACDALRSEADTVVCLTTPEPFWAVGLHYRDFSQTEDAEVEALLRAARVARAAPVSATVSA